ncbi:MAG: hypothetical protein ABFD98_04625 [Syntrophobacteraceae bacterium]|nr:hypothetical protein [Desulfobacteraceae bacterium]
MLTKSLHTAAFKARDDYGREHTILEFNSLAQVIRFEAHGSFEENLKEFRTVKGQPVNRITNGKYKIVPTGLNLYCDEPSAP